MAERLSGAAHDAQASVNEEVWGAGGFVGVYATRELRPAEVMLLVRHRDALRGRVLELGCGAGRLTGYLLELASSVEAIDVSRDMIEFCRRAYPRGSYALRDLRALSDAYEPASFDAIVAPFNVLDVLGDAERGRVLDDIVRLLSPGGLFVFSSHNRAFAPRIAGPLKATWTRNPLRLAKNVTRLPLRMRNRRERRAREQRERDYAILNDNAHDYAILHYYIDRDAQARQLEQHGFELLECLDLDGTPVERGQTAAAYPELHYAAQATSVPAERGAPQRAASSSMPS